MYITILFLSIIIGLSNDANSTELLHSKKKTAFECFFPCVTTVVRNNVIVQVPHSCRRLGRNTGGGARYGTLTYSDA